MTDFETAAALFGGMLMFGAIVSGVAHRSFLALTPVFVVIGLALGDGGFGISSSTPARASSRSSRSPRSS